MAEARQAVAMPSFSFAVGNEGLLIQIDNRAVRHSLATVRRSFVRKLYEIRNRIVTELWPATPAQVLLGGAGIAFLMLYDSPRTAAISQKLWNVERMIPWRKFALSQNMRVGLFAVSSTATALISLTTIRGYTMRLLLSYHGWLWDNPRSPSVSTIVWSLLLRVVTGRHPMLFSAQKTLPRLPVPSLRDTTQRYLNSVRPILSDEKFAEVSSLAADFLKNEGPKIQRYLILKSWFAENYVSDWWEKYVYLAGREPIMINSNYYVLDSSMPPPTHRPTSRGALFLTLMLEFRRSIDHETLEPTLIRGTVPMCMNQYRRIFNTSRIPGHELDTLVHYESSDSKHVVVLRNGSMYILELFHADGTQLTTLEIETQLEWIRRDADEKKDQLLPLEDAIPALTSENRTVWAEARLRYFNTGLNRQSLSAIDSAMGFVVLDSATPADFTDQAHRTFHGSGSDRWFDKSWTLILYENARYGVNAEHSWADAPVLGHMLEHVMGMEYRIGYDANGFNVRPASASNFSTALTTPKRLRFEMSPELQQSLTLAKEHAQALIDDIDTQVNAFTDFGKGFIKKCKLSPDAFFQMALQIAYREDAGEYALTYESSMTRLYLGGRTETVRSLSIASHNFVEAFRNPNASRAEKIKLLSLAADAHQESYRNAMTGHGIDRHLFGLYVVSKGKNIPSKFVEYAMGSSKWRLSTSQQPQGQSGLWDLSTPEMERYVSPGGGFGPVTDDGYGVSYMIAGESRLFFHVSSKNSCKTTDSKRFSNRVMEALRDLKHLFDDTKPAPKQ